MREIRNNKSIKTNLASLFLLIALPVFLFPIDFSQAQFGLGAFWKKYVAAGGAPPNPTGLSATPTDFTVQLSWTSGGGSTASFVVVWSTSGSPANCNSGPSERVSGISASPYTVTGLTAGTPYYFLICAEDGSSNLSSGATVNSTTTNTDRFIFTTDLTYKGNVLPNCATLASAAGLPNSANYVRFIQSSGSAMNTSSVLGGLKLPLKNRRPAGSGGPEIAIQTSFRHTLVASIGYSQTNASVAGAAWTGMNTNGSGFNPAVQCTGWTSAAGGQSGNIGLPTDTGSSTWYSTGSNTCGTATRVICVDSTSGSTPPPDPMGVTFTATSGTTGTLAWTVPTLEVGDTLYAINLSSNGIPVSCIDYIDFGGDSIGSSKTITGLTPGATYYAKVCSEDYDDNFRSTGKVITFTMPSSTILWLEGTLNVTGVSSTGFTASVAFTGDSDNDFSATLYYCNATLNVGCNPENTGTGYGSASMTKSGGNLTAIISGLAPTTWNEYDVLNIRIVATDPDTAYGSPLNGTVTLINVIQPPTTFVQKIQVKAKDGSGSYPYNVIITNDPDVFGHRIAKYGRILVVGTLQDDNNLQTISSTVEASDTATDSGVVWVIRDTSGSGDWTSYVIDKYQKQSTIQTNAIFGKGLAFDGTTIAVGAPGQSGVAGKVLVYREASVNGNWSDMTLKDTIQDPKADATSDCFGCTLAISGRNLFVGDQFDDGKDETAGSEVATLITDSGAVNVYYDSVGDGTGYPLSTPDKKIKQRTDANALNVIGNAIFGNSIAYSGSSLVVGAPGKVSSTLVGKATVYSCTITANGNPCGPTINWAAGTNTITAKVLTTASPMNVPDTLAEGFYGFSVSIDDDTVVVGAPADQTTTETDNTGTTATVGGAYVWHSTNGNADWSSISMVKKLKMRDGTGAVAPATTYQFGIGVAVLGPVIAVGASRGATQQVNVFKDSDGDADFSTGSVTHHQRIQHVTQPDRFGEYVLLDNSMGVFHLTISAYQESSDGSGTDTNPGSGVGYQSGSVFIYGP